MTMTTIVLAVLAFILLLNFFVVLYVVRLVRNAGNGVVDKGFDFLQKEIRGLRDTFDKRIGESAREAHEATRTQFRESQQLIRDINDQMSQQLQMVTKEVSQVGESNKQFFVIAEQLQDLEKTLKHQKQRGNLGEASLELILSNILSPETYSMQHTFADGDTVDAIIRTKEGIVPVDAKFSLDNYQRIMHAQSDTERTQLEKDFKNDLKKRIDETAKYIKPKEGTLPFAFMFIPAEAIYYDLLVNEVGSVKVNTRNLIDYAYKDKGVIVVSPTTFAAYLQSVLYGFRAFKIEESAKEIRTNVERLARHLKAYEEYHTKLGKTLDTTVNHFNAGAKEFKKIDKDILRITGESPEFDAPVLEKATSER